MAQTYLPHPLQPGKPLAGLAFNLNTSNTQKREKLEQEIKTRGGAVSDSETGKADFMVAIHSTPELRARAERIGAAIITPTKLAKIADDRKEIEKLLRKTRQHRNRRKNKPENIIRLI